MPLNEKLTRQSLARALRMPEGQLPTEQAVELLNAGLRDEDGEGALAFMRDHSNLWQQAPNEDTRDSSVTLLAMSAVELFAADT